MSPGGRRCRDTLAFHLVEPMGFEPTTFPVLPGRAQQAFYETAVLLPLDVVLPFHCFTPRRIFFEMSQLPRASILDRLGVVRLVISNALLQMLRLTNVVPTCRFTLKDVNVVVHGRTIGGADGIRTHDLLDAIEARSQLRHGPTASRNDKKL